MPCTLKLLLLCTLVAVDRPILGGPVDQLGSALFDITQLQKSVEARPCCLSSIWKTLPVDPSKTDKWSKLTIYTQDCVNYAAQNMTIPKHKSVSNPTTVRMASYNIHYWDPSADAIFAVIQKLSELGVEVICFQEITLQSKDKKTDFAKKLKNIGYEQQFFIQTQKWGLGNMIVAKKNIAIASKGSGILMHHTWDSGYLKTAITMHGKTMILYATHLDHDKEKDREEQMQQIDGFIEKAQDKNVIIAADWNAIQGKDYQYKLGVTKFKDKLVWDILVEDDKRRGDAPTLLVEKFTDKKGYIDAFQLAHFVPSFTHWTGKSIDCFMTYKLKDFVVEKAYIYFDGASDHLPVIIDVAVKN